VTETAPVIPPETLDEELHPSAGTAEAERSRGYWAEAWRRFRKRKLAMVALGFVVFLVLVALLSPAIVGTKPVIVQYKGSIYFPALGYFRSEWENPVFLQDGFRKRYSPVIFAEKDPEYWAVWPLVFQDPSRRIRADEWPGQPAGARQLPPNRYHLFGTNQQGIDVFAQIVHGARVALLVGFISTGIAAAIGITLGALAGYAGGWADMVVSRIIEMVMSIPSLVLILALIAIVEKPTIWHVMAVLGVTGWTGIARLTRAEFIKLRTSEFVTAARALGARPGRIMFRHILPNALAPVLVPITFGIAAAILIESALSFLGISGSPTDPRWGTVLSDGRRNLEMWWLVVFPGAAIFLAVLAYNLIGEGLQEATDPRLREAGK
jgi:peptide/nickel transport system permease protein